MQPAKFLAYVALAWLIVSVLLLARTIRRGRELSDLLAARHPETYAALGCPRPGFLESARRTRFARFVGRREFEQLGDAGLARQFDAFRKFEARLVISLVASAALLAAIAIAVGGP